MEIARALNQFFYPSSFQCERTGGAGDPRRSVPSPSRPSNFIVTSSLLSTSQSPFTSFSHYYFCLCMFPFRAHHAAHRATSRPMHNFRTPTLANGISRCRWYMGCAPASLHDSAGLLSSEVAVRKAVARPEGLPAQPSSPLRQALRHSEACCPYA